MTNPEAVYMILREHAGATRNEANILTAIAFAIYATPERPGGIREDNLYEAWTSPGGAVFLGGGAWNINPRFHGSVPRELIPQAKQAVGVLRKFMRESWIPDLGKVQWKNGHAGAWEYLGASEEVKQEFWEVFLVWAGVPFDSPYDTHPQGAKLMKEIDRLSVLTAGWIYPSHLKTWLESRNREEKVSFFDVPFIADDMGRLFPKYRAINGLIREKPDLFARLFTMGEGRDPGGEEVSSDTWWKVLLLLGSLAGVGVTIWAVTRKG